MKTIGVISLAILILVSCDKNPTEIKGNYGVFSTTIYDSTENIKNIKLDTLPIYNQKIDPYFFKENFSVLKFLPPNLGFNPNLHEDEILLFGYDSDYCLSYIIEKKNPENEYSFHFDEYNNLAVLMKTHSKLNTGKSTRMDYSIELTKIISKK